MKPESRALLWHARQACAAILRFTRGIALEGYLADELVRSAVERQFEIAGEALSQLAKADPATAARIADHRQVIAFRNVLIHGYAVIEDRRVWAAVSERVPPLEQSLDDLLSEGEQLDSTP